MVYNNANVISAYNLRVIILLHLIHIDREPTFYIQTHTDTLSVSQSVCTFFILLALVIVTVDLDCDKKLVLVMQLMLVYRGYNKCL